VIEVEVKARVGDPASARAMLIAAGAVETRPRHREINTLYDFRDGRFAGSHRAVRLRVVGKKAVLTYKGPPMKSRRFKVREEIETEVKKAGAAAKILAELGLVPVYRYEKRRTLFKKGALTICLDELAIGNFLEVEGERPKIVRFMKALGIGRKDWIRSSYIGLIASAGGAEGAPHSDSLSAPASSTGKSSS
jgi:adenylate cyclase class 2